MSSRERTRQKLVGSMRKTKEIAGIDPGEKDATSDIPAADKSGTAKRVKPATAKSAGFSGNEKTDINGYQSGRRVWPD